MKFIWQILTLSLVTSEMNAEYNNYLENISVLVDYERSVNITLFWTLIVRITCVCSNYFVFFMFIKCFQASYILTESRRKVARD